MFHPGTTSRKTRLVELSKFLNVNQFAKMKTIENNKKAMSELESRVKSNRAKMESLMNTSQENSDALMSNKNAIKDRRNSMMTNRDKILANKDKIFS